MTEETTTTPAPEPTEAETQTADAAELSGSPEQPSAPQTEEPKQRRSDIIAKIAREEKRLREEKQAAQKLKADADARMQEAQKWIQLKDKAAENPLEVLEQLGLNYEQITDYVLGKQQSGTSNKQLDELKDRLDKIEQARQDALERARQAQQSYTVQQYKSQIAAEIKNPAYEFLQAEGDAAVQVVFSVVKNNYDRTGKIMTLPEACKLVEQHYEKQAEKYLTIPKVKSRLAPKQGATNQTAKTNQGTTGATLKNGQQATAAITQKPLTDEERFEKAINLLQSRLS